MKEFDELVRIIKQLRSPSGCPWDRKQTHQSLVQYLFEETNEVVDTIILNKTDKLKEELGDLLLQILLHSKIAEENNDFSIIDVIKILNEKLIRRHPHVFGDKKVNDADDVVVLWKDIKDNEKNNENINTSILDNIPKNFSPLLKSYKLQKKASEVGFDWENYEGILDKIEEELKELKSAIKTNKNIEHELGDVLFSIVNLGRFLKINSDVAIEKANLRFIERFQYIEKKVLESKKDFKEHTIEELEKYWNEAKEYFRNNGY